MLKNQLLIPMLFNLIPRLGYNQSLHICYLSDTHLSRKLSDKVITYRKSHLIIMRYGKIQSSKNTNCLSVWTGWYEKWALK